MGRSLRVSSFGALQLVPVVLVVHTSQVGRLNVAVVPVGPGPATAADVAVFAQAATVNGVAVPELPKQLGGIPDVAYLALFDVAQFYRHEDAGRDVAVRLEAAV